MQVSSGQSDLATGVSRTRKVRWMRRLLLFLVVVAVGVPVAIAVAAAPSVTTNAASSVTTSSATLNSSVNPNGESTNVHYEYGTTILYGSSSSTVAIGNGSSAVSAPRSISGLTAGTTYHFRAVATNSVTINGADRTFVAGATPGVSTDTAINVGRSGDAACVGRSQRPRDDVQSSSTGRRRRALDKSTATTSAGSADSSVSVAANIAGLASNDRIYFRISATNSAGPKTGSTRSFVTAKSIAINELKIPRSRFGGSSKITGDLDGSGVSNQTVTVQGHSSRSPRRSPTSRAPAPAARNFAITVRGITANMRVHCGGRQRDVAPQSLQRQPGGREAKEAPSPEVLRASSRPVAPNGLVRIQKRKSNGKWTNVRKGKLKLYTNGRSRYSLSARKATGVYRVQVVPRDGGAHAAGYSRKVRVR